MTAPARRRRPAMLAATVLTTLALAGCGLWEPVDTAQIEKQAVDPDARVIRFAHQYDPAHPVETCGAATLRTELADDGFTVKSYPSGQIGGEGETTEQIATGGLELGVIGPSFLGVWYPDAAVLDAPFLFTDVEQFDEATTGPIMAEVYDEMAEGTGLRVNSTWYYGTRHITSNMPITEPEDLQGIKIRTPDAPLYLTSFQIMGGSATPMALSEAYLGLQQGAIDAQENPIPTIDVQKFYEVQDYINLTGHMVQAVNIVSSERFMESLTPEERTAFEDAMEKARVATRDCIVEAEEEVLQRWQDEDAIKVNDEVDVAAFQALIAEEFPSRVPWGDLYLEIQESVR
ncbi:DctP family TRAP transporter solute-binding subunit [Brachybacterium sp. J144]|uniref:DctP family TRAP transporter solute-binding subunit n=1 Tax=Brachybacterium sp. J144 TaxID=3116487 RepID=UPI002E77EF94|nr:DctP family TRAP transporter solute-binding subunit [Brachybacterium sp. J144]MEE1650282.1 DctP family TRAP transporter solute-binding subunit [Brachybacterium sp. J144]